MQQNDRCIPCEAKARRNKSKLPFLAQQARQRAKENNKDYAIYLDTEDYEYRISEFSEAVGRGEIVQVVSRLESNNA